MPEHNDSHARRSNGPRRRANYDRINWAKREGGPSPARKAQIDRWEDALNRGDRAEASRILQEPTAE